MPADGIYMTADYRFDDAVISPRLTEQQQAPSQQDEDYTTRI